MATPKKKPEDLLKVGRPSLYRPEYCERVIELGKEGCSPAEIASDLDVDRATLSNWAEAHPEFLTALMRAKIHEQAWFEKAGKAGMFADKFNAQVWAKSVSARFRDDYAERREVTGAGGGPIQQAVTLRTLDVSELDDDQLDALESALVATLGKS